MFINYYYAICGIFEIFMPNYIASILTHISVFLQKKSLTNIFLDLYDRLKCKYHII